MIASGQPSFILDQWWVASFPGMAICIAGLGFNLLGDGLRDVARSQAAVSVMALLEIEDLWVRFPGVRGADQIRAQRRSQRRPGEARIVGESGSGKSCTGPLDPAALAEYADVTSRRMVFDEASISRIAPSARCAASAAAASA